MEEDPSAAESDGGVVVGSNKKKSSPTATRERTGKPQAEKNPMAEISSHIDKVALWIKAEEKSRKISLSSLANLKILVSEMRYMVERVQGASEFIGGVAKEMDDIRAELKTGFAVLTRQIRQSQSGQTVKSTEQPKLSYADVAKRNGGDVVLIYDEKEKEKTDKPDREKSQDLKELIWTTVKPRESKIKVRGVTGVREGGIRIEVGNKESAEKLKGKINTLRDGLVARIAGKRKPRMILYDVDRGFDAEGIKKEVFELNFEESGMKAEDFMARFNPLFKTGPRDGKVVNWVVEVAPEIRAHMATTPAVFVGWRSCRVRDYLRVSRCYKCHSFGHIAKGCQNMTGEDLLCGHCAEKGHKQGDCVKKDKAPTCANCKKTGRTANHSVTDRLCPSYIRALDMESKRYDYGN